MDSSSLKHSDSLVTDFQVCLFVCFISKSGHGCLDTVSVNKLILTLLPRFKVHREESCPSRCDKLNYVVSHSL